MRSGFIEGTYKILEESLTEKKEYKIIIDNNNFTVLPNVFSPKYFKDTEFFLKNIPFEECNNFLEIGAGIGAITIKSIIEGVKKATAIDINKEAIKNIKINVNDYRFNEKIKVILGDLYSNLSEDEKFDIIFWNTPFVFIEKSNLNIMEKSVFDNNYEGIEEFIKGSKSFLSKKGKLLIGFSTTIGRIDLLEKFLYENGFSFKILAKKENIDHNPNGNINIELFEAILKK